MQLCSILINIILSSDSLYYTPSCNPRMCWWLCSWTMRMGTLCLSSRINIRTDHCIAPLWSSQIQFCAIQKWLKKRSPDLDSSSGRWSCCICRATRCRNSNWCWGRPASAECRCRGHSKLSIWVLRRELRFSCRIGQRAIGVLEYLRLLRNLLTVSANCWSHAGDAYLSGHLEKCWQRGHSTDRWWSCRTNCSCW